MEGRIIAGPIAAALAMIMVLSTLGPVAAQDEDFYYTRQMATFPDVNKVVLISAAESPRGSDWVVFALDTVGDEEKGLGVGVIYGHGSDPDLNEWATATYFAPMGIVEYVDDGDGRYSLGGDDVVSLIPLHLDLENREEFYGNTQESDETMTWYPRPSYRPLIYHPRSVVDDVPEDYVIDIEAQTDDDIFTIVMHVTSTVIRSDLLILSPYEVKLDFIIDGYPYLSEDSQLGLLAVLATGNAEWDVGLPEDYLANWTTSVVGEDGWSFPIKGGAGFFSWATVADVDEVEVPVVASTLFHFTQFNWTPEQATTVGFKYIALSYARGDTIIHDPKLGYVFEGNLPPVIEDLVELIRGNGGLFLLSVVVFAGVVYGSRLARRRSTRPRRVQGPPSDGPPPTQGQAHQPAPPRHGYRPPR